VLGLELAKLGDQLGNPGVRTSRSTTGLLGVHDAAELQQE
jgi:hypothetical protein